MRLALLAVLEPPVEPFSVEANGPLREPDGRHGGIRGGPAVDSLRIDLEELGDLVGGEVRGTRGAGGEGHGVGHSGLSPAGWSFHTRSMSLEGGLPFKTFEALKSKKEVGRDSDAMAMAPSRSP